MKRELAFALNAQSQILDSVGRTRSNKQATGIYGGSEFRERKRAKTKSSVVSEPIVDSSVIQIEEAKLVSSACNGVADDERNHSTGSSENEGHDLRKISGENIAVESPLLGKPRDVKEAVAAGGGKKLSGEKPMRRFTRSALKQKEDGLDVPVVENGGPVDRGEEKDGRGSKGCEVVAGDKLESGEEEKSDCATPSAAQRSELEQETGSQIGLTKVPLTVRELFETGMLEGYGVYYNHGKKGPVLRGKIAGTGILCSCSSCEGCKVVPPSVFEIHACNMYRRAVQYICLENGRSFIEVLKACRGLKCDVLEATIREAVGPPPEKVTIACQSCKEPFLTTTGACAESRCNSCVKSTFSQSAASPTNPDMSRSAKSPGTLKSFKSRSTLNSPLPEDINQGKVITRFSNSAGDLKSSISTSRMNFQAGSDCGKVMPRSLKAVSAPDPTGGLHAGKCQQYIAFPNTKSKKLRKLKLRHKTPKSPSSVSSSKTKSSGKITKKDLRMHKLVFEEGALPDGTELGYYAGGKRLLEGYKKGSGIYCLCCNSVVSASQFEAHAGCAARRKPYCYIYTSNGVSLHELSISLASKHTFKESDDLCIICADGGKVVICDLCPRVFHPECASLDGIPRGKWYCKYCQNMFHRESFVAYNANAIAAGRVSGVDPIKEISKRCIRIVNDFETDATACVLCSGSDFSQRFGPRTIILCDQCEKEYHVGCLKDHSMADLKELPKGNWFCTSDCVRIHSTLQNLLVRGSEQLPESLIDVIRKKNMQNSTGSVADMNISWRIINGNITSKGTKALLLQAIAIFHDGFSPIVDGRTGRDLIPAMVYGNMRGLEYKGMYCAVLTVNSLVVSAAVFRVFGTEVAELPLVATINGSHGKGYFQTLYGCVERLLASLEVKSIVLPAAEEAKAIWTDRFGFRHMTLDEISSYQKNCCPMVFFQGTVMLHKAIPACEVANSN
ncbi:hypothetical protein Dimus_007079 [Dionaea muscipula]